MGIPADKLWITIHTEDDEAFDIGIMSLDCLKNASYGWKRIFGRSAAALRSLLRDSCDLGEERGTATDLCCRLRL
ncbi:MAG: hypothetical protein ACLRXQ_00625 [Phascolarctobacterium faecium]